MRTTKMALLAATMMLPLSFSAHAADAIMDQPAEPPVADMATAPAYLWAGGYAGVFGVYSRGDTDVAGDGNNGFGGGLYGGYNWQVDKFVYGVEADVALSNNDTNNGVFGAEQGVNGSLRARLGYDVNPFLVYATGGLAASKFKLNNGTSDDSNVHYGYTVGAGAEAFLTKNITARVEYRYTDYQSKDYNLDIGNVSSGFDDNSVRVGLGVKF